MIVLVVSDSHGRNEHVRQAVEQTKKKYGSVDMLLHMGDVETNVEEIMNMIDGPVHIVAGNNDGGLSLPRQLLVDINGLNVFMTHGHQLGVDYNLHRLELMAETNEASVAMYGHTHYPYLDRNGDIVLLNPGSLTYPRQEGREKTFMVMDVDDEGNAEYYWQELGGEEKRQGFFSKIFGK